MSNEAERVPTVVGALRALAIVDGEHYAPVVRDALAELPYEFVAAVLVGGQEKLRGGEEYGVPLVDDVETAIAQHAPDVVVDLSDEPVLGPIARFALASRVLACGMSYVGADFRLDPPARGPFELPSIAVVGTGKRVGKTAVTGYLARLLAAERRVVVVAMGRGGPAHPEVVTVPPTVDALVELSRSGRHAASDHLETAALVGVATVGCRRCGGGLAGGVATSNVEAGARIAIDMEPDVVVFDGSGAAFPPIAAARTVVVVGGHQDPAIAAGYLNTYRLLLADLVIVTMAVPWSDWKAVRQRVADTVRDGVPVVATTLHPRALGDVAGRSTAYFCTAPETAHASLRHILESTYGAHVVHVSGNLANRGALREELAEIDAEVYLVELKAAAIDVVAEAALVRGAEVVLAANDVVPLSGEPDLDELLLGMAKFPS
jgi:cyclic 2,3-diphosphoglycerate synthetase